MESIKILFFILGSFFGMENVGIAADKTTVTIYPKKQEIEIIQENLFTVIQSEKDKALVLEQWDKLFYWKEKNTPLAKELDNFNVKSFTFTIPKETIQPHLTLSYSKQKDLQAMGIWYNEEKNQFSINHIPEQNIKTKNGKLEDNYWIFKGESTFSFTIEPFLQMAEKYKTHKHSLKDIVDQQKKE